MERIKIKADVREELGTKASKVLRREGQIPCVIYDADTAVHIKAEANDFKDLVFTDRFKVAEIEVNGETHDCILKEIQFHPVTDEVLHIDFLRLTEGRKVAVQVPLHFEGQSPGVKAGGKLLPKVRTLAVKGYPKDLIDEIVVDISEVDLGDTLRVRDVEIGEELELLDPANFPIAAVKVPRLLVPASELEEGEEEEEEGEEGEEGAEGEEGEGVESKEETAEQEG